MPRPDNQDPSPAPQHAPVVEMARSTGATLLNFLLLRAELASVEAREAGRVLALAAMLGSAAGMLIGWADLLVTAALIWMLAEKMGWPWTQVALGAAALHLVLGIGLIIALRSRLSAPFFAESMNQLRRDRECLEKPEIQSR